MLGRTGRRVIAVVGPGRLPTRLAMLVACLVLAACGTGGGAPSRGGSAHPAGSPSVAADGPSGPNTTSPRPTLPSAPDPILLAVGDIASCSSTDDDAVAALVASLDGVVATLGDTAYDDGTPDELRDCFAGPWEPVIPRIRYAVTGNHDDLTDSGLPLRQLLGAAAERDGRTYFADDLGPWHVVVLDANCDVVEGGCGPGSPQLRWLRADLAANPAACTLALWHQPRFSSGYHGDDERVGPFWDALAEAGAELVLNGHDHDYERFDPQDPTGAKDPEQGITEIVLGTGGGEARAFNGLRANSVVRASGVFGVLQLTLHGGGWDWRFVDTAGTFTDGGTGTCH
jgi:hypothetical protein